MSNLDISYYEYFKQWIKYLTSEDIGALMLVIPFALAVFALVVILALVNFWATVFITITVLWFIAAVYLMTKN